MEFYVGIACGLLVGLLLGRPWRRAKGAEQPNAPLDELYRISAQLSAFYEQTANPSDLLGHEAFQRGVELLATKPFQTSELLAYYNGDNIILACVALEALSRRPDEGEDLAEPILKTLNTVAPWTRWFALRALSARGKPPLVGRLLSRVDDSWDNRFGHLYLREFFDRQVAGGEAMSLGPEVEALGAEQAAFVDHLLAQIGDETARGLREELTARRSTLVDIDFISSVGKVWEREEGDDRIVEHEGLREGAGRLLHSIRQDRRGSVLVVGPSGVGKTALLRFAARQLQTEGWTVFEASATQIMAGQVFMGELEGRIQGLVQAVGGDRRVLWVIPRFHELMWAGRHRFSPISLLDLLLPAIENGEIRVAGETQLGACDQLLRRMPLLQEAFDVLRLDAPCEAETLALARRVADALPGAGGPSRVGDDTLHEALQLAQQYLGEKSAPGHVLDLLKSSAEAKQAQGGQEAEPLTSRDLLRTLSRLTGLPFSILDERESLDLNGLRAFFEGRVLGQPEAVDCLVDRVAMIKAGLADPGRPLGVFLFTGPTGTGKTELAKALAEFLFGSPERMVRLDMSEFQTEDALGRLVGDPGDAPEQEALGDRIRNQPFAVVLLDEFEKAHPRIWDVFLQLFDDGRLTDRRGNTADFRHAIVIMTSNLGGSHERHIGFGAEPEWPVQRTMESVFRKEFLNRIDRIVVFRALSRAVMREILMKELDDVLGRRGLRTRTWAVEWEPSAIDFLLARGFTDDLGARPLKRAIERHLLSPLATTIVTHQFPEGDQFLFVRSDGERIEVAFVDPDAPEEVPVEAPEIGRAVGEALRVQDVVLAPRGQPGEVALLQQHFARLQTIVGGDEWTDRKAELLDAMSRPGFWESGERFPTLGLAEYMDRIEEGLRTAESLLARLTRGANGERETFSVSLMRRVAQRIHLVDAACQGLKNEEPYDAFVLVEAARDSGGDAKATDAFAARLGAMYRDWAKRRGMQCATVAEAHGGPVGPFRLLLAISGFAVYPILKPEHGLHVLEVPSPKDRPVRLKARVRVCAQPDEPMPTDPAARGARAEAAMEASDAETLRIVRRYREEPSPLVRDTVRNFRTGRIDLVWQGDFDLL